MSTFNALTPLRKYFGTSRGSRVRLSVAAATTAKGAYLIVGLLLTPLVLRHLGKQGYGLFITITAVVSWLQIANFGIGSGLQNALTEAVAARDQHRQQVLISTAFMMLLLIGAFVAVSGTTACLLLPWSKLFRVSDPSLVNQVTPAVAIVFSGFVSTFILGFVGAIAAARQELYLQSTSSICAAALQLVLVLSAVYLRGSLLMVVAATIGSGVIVNWTFAAWYLLRANHSHLRPRMFQWSRAAWNRIFRSSAAFFVIQICSIALFETDYFIIARLLKLEDVTPYSIATKPFAILSALVLASVIQPLWAAYGNAKAENDLTWIRRVHKRVVLIFMSLQVVFVLTLILAGRSLLIWWVGITFAPPTILIATTGLYFMIRQWTDLHAGLVNGLDMMKPQAISAIFHTVVTISFEIVLVGKLGIVGIPLGCLLGYALVSAWFLPMLAHRSLRHLARVASAQTAFSGPSPA